MRDDVCSMLGVLSHIQTSLKSCTVFAYIIQSNPVAIATMRAWLTAYWVLVRYSIVSCLVRPISLTTGRNALPQPIHKQAAPKWLVHQAPRMVTVYTTGHRLTTVKVFQHILPLEARVCVATMPRLCATPAWGTWWGTRATVSTSQSPPGISIWIVLP